MEALPLPYPHDPRKIVTRYAYADEHAALASQVTLGSWYGPGATCRHRFGTSARPGAGTGWQAKTSGCGSRTKRSSQPAGDGAVRCAAHRPEPGLPIPHPSRV